MADAPLYQIRRVTSGGQLLGFTVYKNGEKGIFFHSEEEAEEWVHEDFLRDKPRLEEVICNYDVIEGKFSGWK